jgi:pre-mRNA-splicing factor ISY1
MARPEEKANSMMNKWVSMRESSSRPKFSGSQLAKRDKRPALASECSSLNEAERFRRQLLREISDLIAKIQNPGLGEHIIRDTNDAINRKIREKYHWNKRIKELGGPDFQQLELKQQMENAVTGEGDMNSIMGSGGYRYYGAAKDLPGVRELFERQQQQQNRLSNNKRNRADIYKRITPDYFGWREEEDGVLLELEQKATQMLRSQRDQKMEQQQFHSDIAEGKDSEGDNEILRNKEEKSWIFDPSFHELSPEFIAEAMLQRKKQELLARFS